MHTGNLEFMFMKTALKIVGETDIIRAVNELEYVNLIHGLP